MYSKLCAAVSKTLARLATKAVRPTASMSMHPLRCRIFGRDRCFPVDDKPCRRHERGLDGPTRSVPQKKRPWRQAKNAVAGYVSTASGQCLDTNQNVECPCRKTITYQANAAADSIVSSLYVPFGVDVLVPKNTRDCRRSGRSAA